MRGLVRCPVTAKSGESPPVSASVVSINEPTTRFSSDSYPRISSWRSGREDEKKFSGCNRTRSSVVRAFGVFFKAWYSVRVSCASSARSGGGALDPKERMEIGCKNLIRSEETCLLNPSGAMVSLGEPWIK
jgi:hypothetical protein